MFQFGSPQNWDASPGEHNLIDLAKQPAQCGTQKCNETFIMQTTQRLQETAILSKASHLIDMQQNRLNVQKHLALWIRVLLVGHMS